MFITFTPATLTLFEYLFEFGVRQYLLYKI